jgi:hypothetical protein
MKGKCFSLTGLIVFIYVVTVCVSANGQSLTTGQETRYNPISTAVPFLTITPDSRHGAMGNTGVATSPDANAQYLNPSKYAFAEEHWGVSASYTPWLRKLVNDVNLAYVSGYYSLKNNQAIGASLRYFSMGDVALEDINGTNLGSVRPNEFALDFSYSRKLSDYFSGGIAFRYIRTDLNGGMSQEAYTAGNAIAADVSFFYTKRREGGYQPKTFSWGVDLSNIGSKISYNGGQTREFLPANMRLGAAFTNEFDELNSLSFSFDINKLLVPTPLTANENGSGGGLVVITDSRSNESVMEGIFSSFTDAPGGFKEELQEYTVSTGLEYWYNKRFALRTGYFNEAQNKGNRKFFTMGAGFKASICSIDFSYLIPVQQNNPLANTIRFTISFNPGVIKKETKPGENGKK